MQNATLVIRSVRFGHPLKRRGGNLTPHKI
nr:MAG TPA: hypothetical protein [Caudoviricetes sp.]